MAQMVPTMIRHPRCGTGHIFRTGLGLLLAPNAQGLYVHQTLHNNNKKNKPKPGPPRYHKGFVLGIYYVLLITLK